MDTRLKPQLQNSTEIKSILKKVDVTYKLGDGRNVETLLVFLPPGRDENPLIKFFSAVKDGIMSNFVFKCSEVEKKLGISKSGAAEKLFEKAIRKLSQKTAQGELGELILFTLMDVYLEAPKLLSKVADKPNPRMPVFGADGVHGQFCDGKFRLFLGESKLYKDFKAAATKAAESIKSAKQAYQGEFDLLDSNMDFPNITADLEEYLLDILDPFSEVEPEEYLYLPCFIGFSKPELMKFSGSDFKKAYIDLAAEYVGDFYRKIENQDLDVQKTALLILPFESIDELVRQFIDFMGIQK
ncbi:MAG: DUF1837 domain-containing protein [Pseudomonadota bacterium]